MKASYCNGKLVILLFLLLVRNCNRHFKKSYELEFERKSPFPPVKRFRAERLDKGSGLQD